MLPSLVRALLVRIALAAMSLASFSLGAAPVVAQQTAGASAPAPVVLVGRVTDAGNGTPIASADVLLKSGGVGATTDAAG
ncbi:MAG TPA: hypothetical protein VIQ60_08940, partial [Gemmatimonadaceae bacterium]